MPFIVSGPGVPKNRKIPAPIYLQDVMPSTLELAGVKKPEHVQFKDIMPLVFGENNTPPYKEIYGAYLDAQRSITVGNAKLLVYPNVPTVRVYDLLNDPLEIKDIANTKKGKAIATKLFPKLLKLQVEMDDQLDLKKSFPELSKNI